MTASLSNRAKVPILGFAAYSGTGKTTLLLQILPLLKARGLRIGMLKHAHHTFDIDHPGKDSFELRKAGADQMLVASRQRWALMVEQTEARHEPTLEELLPQMIQTRLDLILVEGFKHEPFPKIELHRPDLGHPFLYPDDPTIIALACDVPVSAPLPVLDLNQPVRIAAWILDYCGGLCA